jgi:hypothetical protein
MANIIIAGLVIAGVLLAVVAIIYFGYKLIRRWLKKRKPDVPQDVLNDFEYVQRRYEEYGEDANPQQILWELAQRKSGHADRIRKPEIPKLPKHFERRYEIQSNNVPTERQAYTTERKDNRSVTKDSINNRKGIGWLRRK